MVNPTTSPQPEGPAFYVEVTPFGTCFNWLLSVACLAWVTQLVVSLLPVLPPVSLEYPSFPAQPCMGLHKGSVLCGGE
jgi:hypothetical protein